MSNVYKQVLGSGEPILLLHGWAMHSGVWGQFLQNLADSHQVICVDLPGHGHSEDISPINLQHLSETLIESVPQQSFHLLGWSLGGTIAIEMAARFPDRVRSLAIMAANPCFVGSADWPGCQPELFHTFRQRLHLDVNDTIDRFLALQTHGIEYRQEKLKQLNKAVLALELPSLPILISYLDILQRSRLTTTLAQINCPVLTILGENDPLVPIACGNAIAHLCRDAKSVVLKNTGHAPFLTHAPEIADILSDFYG